MSCTTTCVHPRPTQAHCAADGCHRTFNTLTGFDFHRRAGVCVDPTTLDMTEKNGSWRMPLSESRRAWLAQISGSDSGVPGEPQSDETGPAVGRDTPGNSEAANSSHGGGE